MVYVVVCKGRALLLISGYIFSSIIFLVFLLKNNKKWKNEMVATAIGACCIVGKLLG